MAKIIYVCLREPSQEADAARAVAAVADRLSPDNLSTIPARILTSNGVVAGLSGRSDLIGVRDCSVAAGYLVKPGNWDRPRSGRPDGAYALFRSDDKVVEVVTDTVGSRTIWYALTDRMFIASTSQRAIVALLGSFQFNPDTVPWMLAAGFLGPDQSWDRRIRCLPGASSIVLDRRSWTLQEQCEPVRFEPDAVPDREQKRRMVDALRHAVGVADVAGSQWAITLSGGVDCRAILCLLQKTQGLRAVTWGLRASLNDPANDASIARRLARHFGIEHQYFETDLATESVDRVFDRFVANGEGRIDHVSGYADGFSLWRKLHDIGVRGIIRGDEVFGLNHVRTTRELRSKYLPLWCDFSGLPPLASLGLPPQVVPDWLQQQASESVETWRDRIQHQYRNPYVIAALSDLKLPYVEIINPLISGSLVELARRLPDHLRTDKTLFRQVAKSLSPNIPYASNSALQPPADLLKWPQVVSLLRDCLSSQRIGSYIPSELIAYMKGGLVQSASGARPASARPLRRALRACVPAWAARLARSSPAHIPAPGHNRLAFRAYLIERTSKLLAEDALALPNGSAHG